MRANRKKLIEVALPLKAINEASAREKSIRHGHPSTLHLWWARRPLAACRAVLFASLVDDPDSDPAFAGDEERAAVKRAQLFNLIEELVQWENSNNDEVIRSARAEIARSVASNLVEQGTLAKDHKLAGGTTLGELIRDGHCMPVPAVESNGRAKKDADSAKRFRFATAHLPPAEAVNDFLANRAPPVLDPFCGGGSIPLEAQRLGLRAYASDLNPVPVLITKALIEIPPKFAGMPPVNPEARGQGSVVSGQKGKPPAPPGGKASSKVSKKTKKTQQQIAGTQRQWKGAEGLADDVRYYGKWMRDEAEKRIGHLYPRVKITKAIAKDRPDLEEYVGEELTVIAWLWARTVRCPNPACGVQMPLVRSFDLASKKGLRTWVEPQLANSQMPPNLCFHVKVGSAQSPVGTVKGRSITCSVCKTGTLLPYVRSEAQAGRMGRSLIAIIAEGRHGRVHLSPNPQHESVAQDTTAPWKPDQKVTTPCHDVDRLPMYGMFTWGDAFTTRQLVLLTALCDLIMEARNKIITDASRLTQTTDRARPLASCGSGSVAYADSVATYLSLGVGRQANYSTTLTAWGGEFIVQTFARNALRMVWDYAEGNPFSESTGNWMGAIEWIAKCIEQSAPAEGHGNVVQLDATVATPDAVSPTICTDPPYYDNIGYADLSDFFYVWLRRALVKVYPQLFATLLTPKAQELIAAAYRHDGDRDAAKTFFEQGLVKSFKLARKVQDAEYPLTVFYAFKQTESADVDDDDYSSGGEVSTGWETMLEGLLQASFSVTGTWPLRTERDQGLKTGTNVLASSIVLVCRPRPPEAPLATRKEFIRALRDEVPEALRNLQHGNIAPVDLAQAAIGPGMAVFTRYAKVVESDGSPMTVRTALGLINQTLDEVLAEQEGEFDADTRWALAWFQEYGTSDGPFGVAETLSKAKNTAVNGLVEAGVIAARGGKVRLVKRDELPDDWDPADDDRLAIWEVTQHLIRTLEQDGETAAAELVHKLGGTAEIARDLAYRLYNICERKKWADEALSYNGLVLAWPELTKLALAERKRGGPTQQGLAF
jgi:putative DNA methylase